MGFPCAPGMGIPRPYKCGKARTNPCDPPATASLRADVKYRRRPGIYAVLPPRRKRAAHAPGRPGARVSTARRRDRRRRAARYRVDARGARRNRLDDPPGHDGSAISTGVSPSCRSTTFWAEKLCQVYVAPPGAAHRSTERARPYRTSGCLLKRRSRFSLPKAIAGFWRRPSAEPRIHAALTDV